MKPLELIQQGNALLSDRVRLAIVATLAAADGPVDFNTLLKELELTKGNLSAHAQKLEDAGLVAVTKEFVGKKPRTTYQCTELGRTELRKYLAQIESLLKLAGKN